MLVVRGVSGGAWPYRQHALQHGSMAEAFLQAQMPACSRRGQPAQAACRPSSKRAQQKEHPHRSPPPPWARAREAARAVPDLSRRAPHVTAASWRLRHGEPARALLPSPQSHPLCESGRPECPVARATPSGPPDCRTCRHGSPVRPSAAGGHQEEGEADSPALGRLGPEPDNVARRCPAAATVRRRRRWLGPDWLYTESRFPGYLARRPRPASRTGRRRLASGPAHANQFRL